MVFMLFKDLIKVYKVYFVHVGEVLERFEGLRAQEARRGLKMYTNFVKLTELIQAKANKLVYQFNFPIQLPDFYQADPGLLETLTVVVEAQDGDREKAHQAAKKVRGQF